MNLLAIGNSYSDDATALLSQVAAADNVHINAVNLFEGGCSLEKHIDNLENNRASYIYEENGILTDRRVTSEEVLKENHWDIITIQQASRFSGILDSFFPYAEQLLAFAKSLSPDSKFYFHQTWAYERDFRNEWFNAYSFSQEKMFEAIFSASFRVASRLKTGMIRTGEVIQALRAKKPFDYENGGISLNRDGLHLSLTYGRLAAALSYYTAVTGNDVRGNTFAPEGTAPDIAQLVRETVYEVYSRKVYL